MNKHLDYLRAIKKMLMDFNYLWDSKMMPLQKKDLNAIISELDNVITSLSKVVS